MTDCVIYTRVSSKEQEEGFSLDAQLDLLRKYARDHDFHVAREYVEVESAKAPGRAKFALMLEYIRANPGTVLLVEKTDRLVRNLKDYITIEDLKANVHFVKEGNQYGPDAKSSDKFMQGIRVLMARQYIDNLREEVKKGMVKRAEAGKWSCTAPYGYHSNPETHSLEIVPAEAEGIKWLFVTYASGEYTLKQLASEFRLKGFPWRSARPMYPTLAHKMLNNPIYMGIVKWGGCVYEGEHEPIVEPTLWQKVQEIIHRRSRPKVSKHDFPYRGLVRCGHCGCLLTGSINKGHRYYKCSNARGKCNGNGYIREDKLADEFGRILKAVRLAKIDCDAIASAIADFKATEIRERDSEIEKLQKQAARLRTKMDGSYDDYLDGNIDQGMWQRAHLRHTEQYNVVRDRIQQLENADLRIYHDAERVIRLVRDAAGEFERGNADKRKGILKVVVSNCTMTSGKLHYSYKRPFDIIAEGSKTSDWWS